MSRRGIRKASAQMTRINGEIRILQDENSLEEYNEQVSKLEKIVHSMRAELNSLQAQESNTKRVIKAHGDY